MREVGIENVEIAQLGEFDSLDDLRLAERRAISELRESNALLNVHSGGGTGPVSGIDLSVDKLEYQRRYNEINKKQLSEKAKARYREKIRPKKIAATPQIPQEEIDLMFQLQSEGVSITKISERVSVSGPTVAVILRGVYVGLRTQDPRATRNVDF
jgi:hypothetical protein